MTDCKICQCQIYHNEDVGMICEECKSKVEKTVDVTKDLKGHIIHIKRNGDMVISREENWIAGKAYALLKAAYEQDILEGIGLCVKDVEADYKGLCDKQKNQMCVLCVECVKNWLEIK